MIKEVADSQTAIGRWSGTGADMKRFQLRTGKYVWIIKEGNEIRMGRSQSLHEARRSGDNW